MILSRMLTQFSVIIFICKDNKGYIRVENYGRWVGAFVFEIKVHGYRIFGYVIEMNILRDFKNLMLT